MHRTGLLFAVLAIVLLAPGAHAEGADDEPKDGAAMLALKTGAKVIPAFISGVKHHDNVVLGLIVRHRARVRFGAPVDLSEHVAAGSDREQVRLASRRIYAAIKALGPKKDEVTATEDSGCPVNHRRSDSDEPA